MSTNVMNVKFNNGQEMPMVGLGTYARKSEPGQVRQAVEWAIELGYRHIDTATAYKNEEEVGEAIANKISEGIVKREDLFVTTKLWNDCHDKDVVVVTLKQSLKKLKLDYIDLYLIHWPVSVSATGVDTAISYTDTWKGMERTIRLGLAKSIGVSNFNEKQLQNVVVNSQVKPVVNQIEVNPTFTQQKLVEFCKELAVIPVAYTPLGLLSEARPEFAGKDFIKTDLQLGEIARKYKKTRAQVALRYLIQRGIPVIPKSFTKSRIEENINIFDFELTEDDMSIVDSYNIDHRCVPGKEFKKLAYYPY